MDLADGNLLVIGFDTSWPDLFSALEEVQDSLHPGNINRVAINPDGQVVAWLGGRSAYDGHAWELHPLVVHPDFQGQGIGLAYGITTSILTSFIKRWVSLSLA